MKLMPRKGLKVFNPATKLHLKDDIYTEVEKKTYWMRRLADGDVVEFIKEKEVIKNINNMEVIDDNII